MSRNAYVKDRIKEPSSWAGMALALGMGVSAWKTGDWSQVAAAIGGLFAILLPESKPVVSQEKPKS